MAADTLTPEAVAKTALLARLGLTPSELDVAAEGLSGILQHIEKLTELDLEGVLPMAHPHPNASTWREDMAVPGLSVDEALGASPERLGDGFGVPKIIE